MSVSMSPHLEMPRGTCSFLSSNCKVCSLLRCSKSAYIAIIELVYNCYILLESSFNYCYRMSSAFDSSLTGSSVIALSPSFSTPSFSALSLVEPTSSYLERLSCCFTLGLLCVCSSAFELLPLKGSYPDSTSDEGSS